MFRLNVANTSSRPRTSKSLKIAVWNLRVPFEQDESTWSDRRDSVASAIAERHPHILATQEDCHFMNLDLEQNLLGKKNSSYERCKCVAQRLDSRIGSEQ